MDNYIITIARSVGSGGRTIGEKLASKLGIKYIDQELLKMASDESGISEELFREADEKINVGLFMPNKAAYSTYLLTPDNKEFVSNENMFNYQAKILTYMALNESFVVIGRAADYVLKDFPNIVKVAIVASDEHCVKNTMKRLNISQEKAEKLIKKTNKYRSDYYRYYTAQKWMESTNYDFTINSTKLSDDKCVDSIISLAEIKLGKKLL